MLDKSHIREKSRPSLVDISRLCVSNLESKVDYCVRLRGGVQTVPLSPQKRVRVTLRSWVLTFEGRGEGGLLSRGLDTWDCRRRSGNFPRSKHQPPTTNHQPTNKTENRGRRGAAKMKQAKWTSPAPRYFIPPGRFRGGRTACGGLGLGDRDANPFSEQVPGMWDAVLAWKVG